jgi:hypothetical protein
MPIGSVTLNSIQGPFMITMKLGHEKWVLNQVQDDGIAQ